MPSQKGITTLKKILHAGKGEPLEFPSNTKVVFHYEVFIPPEPASRNTAADGDSNPVLFPEDSFGKPLELVIGRKFQLPLFEECVKTMLVDEVSRFDVYDPAELVMFPIMSKKLRDIARADVDPNFDLSHCETHHCAASGPVKLGYSELDELMGKPRPLMIVFHLLSILRPNEYEQDSWQLNDQQKLASLETIRTEGNRLFSAKEYEGAANKYQEALGLLDKLLLKEKPNDSEWNELDQKNVPFYLNLSQCYLNLGRFYDATECASEALKRESCNEKALFRRIKARIGTWDFDSAELDIASLEALGSTSQKLIQSLRSDIEDKRKLKLNDDKNMFKNMFPAKK